MMDLIERAPFERWAKENGLWTRKNEEHVYTDIQTQMFWDCWCSGAREAMTMSDWEKLRRISAEERESVERGEIAAMHKRIAELESEVKQRDEMLHRVAMESFAENG